MTLTWHGMAFGDICTPNHFCSGKYVHDSAMHDMSLSFKLRVKTDSQAFQAISPE